MYINNMESGVEPRTKKLPIWAERIELLIKSQGITQKILSEKTHLSKSIISQWLSGNSNITLDNIQSVAKALNVTVAYLIGEIDGKTPGHEKISKLTGLSDTAIDSLKKAQKEKNGQGISNRVNGKKINESEIQEILRKKVEAWNFLMEHIFETTLLENIYDYLFGNIDEEAETYLLKITNDGEKRIPITSDVYLDKLHLSKIKYDLKKIKYSIVKEKRGNH